MRRSTACLIIWCLAGLMVGDVSAMSPPEWVGPGTTVTYEAALTPYYAIDSDDPLERWVHYEGSGVYGFWIEKVLERDETGYSGDYTVISVTHQQVLLESEWSYQQGDPYMSQFWIDLDGPIYGEIDPVLEGPIEIAGKVWNAQVYYFASIGNAFDIRVVVEKESGLILCLNEGLTGADGRMQRHIRILHSIENPQPGMSLPENTTSGQENETLYT